MALTTVRPEGLGFVNGRRNLIINGAMQVAQRGTVTGVTSGYGGPDRFVFVRSGAAAVDMSQSTDVPSGSGFAKSTKLDVSTADSSLAAGDYALWAQRFEGLNLQSIKKGSSNAEKLTASFWIKSSTTGTYILEIFDSDNTRQVSASYSVSTADTWEHKVITFPADTTGALDDDNVASFTMTFWLAAGSTFSGGTLNTSWAANTNANRAVGQVNAVDDTANNIYFTGVQLEIGETATPFEHRSFDEEMRLCLRYFERFKRSYSEMGQSSSADATLWAGCSRSGNSGNNQGVMRYTRKRNNPSVSVSSATYINSIFPISPFNSTLSGFGISGNAGIDSAFINATNNASSAPGSDCASFVYIPNDSGYLDVDAEL